MTNTPHKSRIPAFKNYQEEAAFWDTHSFTEFLDETKPVNLHFAKNLSQKLAVRLDTQTLTAVQQEAHRKGIGPSTLVRMLVKDYFHAHPTNTY